MPERPSEFETQILALLWRIGPATAREVLGQLPDGKKRAYTSVLSVMQVMEKKGLLARDREGITDRWRPLVSEAGVLGPFFRNLVANIFGGKPTAVLQHLLRETEVNDTDLAEIRRLLDAHEKRGKTPDTRSKPRKKGN
jgi:predicted transcriptional regulator